MTTPEIRIDLTIDEMEADAERLNDLTVHLMHELRDLGEVTAERPAGEAVPAGAKGDPVTLGALALATVPAVIPKLVEFLRSWVMRGENRKVKIKTPAGLEIEFTPEKKLSKDAYLSLVELLTQAKDPNRAAELLNEQKVVSEAATKDMASAAQEKDPERETEIETRVDDDSISHPLE